MTPLILIRHGPTDWNAERRIQGHQDTSLSEAGRAAVRTWRRPAELIGAGSEAWDWLSSPLARAWETAALLWPERTPRIEPVLIEMRWGAWEGHRLEDIGQEDAAALVEAEALGLDFRPPGGESRREVQVRLRPLLAGLAAAQRPTAAVTHKGVLRAVLALALGWDMTAPPRARLLDGCAHRFLLDPSGLPRPDRLNLPLTP